jgi:hypothetical protein
MRFELRDYQRLAVDHAVAFLSSASPGDRQLYAAPTGSGKSVIELAIQSRLDNAWIVTPRLEIVAGLLDKAGIDTENLGVDRLAELGYQHCIVTPIRYRNMMLKGDGIVPSYLILDEAHHDSAETWRQLHLLSGAAPSVGFTATPFRGSPRSTASLLETWGEPVYILTYKEAADRGVISIPDCKIVPLLDDDLVQVSNGEFVIEDIERQTNGRMGEIVDYAARWFPGSWDRPTMFALPSVECAYTLASWLTSRRLPADCVTGDTNRADRDLAFRNCLAGKTALVQVQVVSEGVDLPIRRLVDLSPAISPVKWLQQFGRITRPSVSPPEYVCCNRNLLRHAYLLEGCLPARTLVEASTAFGGLGGRIGGRVLGLESLGRFKAAEIPLKDGSTGFCYCLSSVEGATIREYAVLVHPGKAEPIWATRTNGMPGENRAYGRWKRCEPPNGVSGFASVPAREPSEKQLAWWKQSAGKYGLDPDGAVNRRNFVCLPVLSDLRRKL